MRSDCFVGPSVLLITPANRYIIVHSRAYAFFLRKVIPTPRFDFHIPVCVLAFCSVLAAHGAPRVATAPAHGDVAVQNPLLPPQLALDGASPFFPDLSMVAKSPTVTPEGYRALYSAADWQAYRATFGTEADGILRLKTSAQLDFVQKLLDAAKAETFVPANPNSGGLRRLLLIRAVAVAYRHKEGTPLAAQAIALYQQSIDLDTTSHVAALWTLTDALTRYASTPKPDRAKFSNLAARANIQLAVLFLDANQIAAAQTTIKWLSRHDPATRADPTLRPSVVQARSLVAQSAAMLDYLNGRCAALVATVQAPNSPNADPSAAMPLYLYARFVKPNRGLLNEVLSHRGTSAVGPLHNMLEQANADPLSTYAAADALKAAAAGLPEGILKHRTMYASLQLYRSFAANPKTESERVKRTLAHIAIEALLGDGARPAPTFAVLTPVAPATAPSTSPSTAPGTMPATAPSTAPSTISVPSTRPR